MPHTDEYRPPKGLGPFGLLFAGLSIAGGIAAWWVHGSVVALVVLTLVGGLFLVGAVAALRTRVVVDAEGLEKYQEFRIPWEEVESWRVRWGRARGSPVAKAVEVRVRGQRLPRVILDWEVEDPGLGPFLTDLRRYVGPKEETTIRLTPREFRDPAWRRVALGLWLKFLALLPLAGALGVVIAAGVTGKHGRDFWMALLAWPFEAVLDEKWALAVPPTAIGAFAVAVVLDAAGRVLCLTGPQALRGQRAVLGSVLVQGAALALLVGLAWAGAAEQKKIAAAAVLAQLGAAVLFVNYLTELALAVGRPDMIPFLSSAGGVAGTGLGCGLGLVLLVILLFVPGLRDVVLVFFSLVYLLSCCGMGLVFVGMPILYFAILAMYFSYGRALVGLAREIGRLRREAAAGERTAAHEGSEP